MNIPYYQVNAFTSNPFGGNPAGVCLLDRWLADSLLQQIAAENDFSETAFLVRNGHGFELRWMTPAAEVDLCGHATLAAAHVLFFERAWPADSVLFATRSGPVAASRDGELIELDFPSRPPVPCPAPLQLLQALGRSPLEVLRSRDFMAVFGSSAEVLALEPRMDLLCQLDCLGIIATAPGKDADFVSRFFAPKVGVPEDPVTGSAHASLIPYWAARLAKNELNARQISQRGGELRCRAKGDRVGIAGNAVTYCRGELAIP